MAWKEVEHPGCSTKWPAAVDSLQWGWCLRLNTAVEEDRLTPWGLVLFPNQAAVSAGEGTYVVHTSVKDLQE